MPQACVDKIETSYQVKHQIVFFSVYFALAVGGGDPIVVLEFFLLFVLQEKFCNFLLLPGGLGSSERRRFASIGSFGFRQGPHEEMPHQSGRLHPNGSPIGLLSGTKHQQQHHFLFFNF